MLFWLLLDYQITESKSRFRRIFLKLNSKIEDIHTIVKVAFTLNNICEDFGNVFYPNWLNQSEGSTQIFNYPSRINTETGSEDGRLIRESYEFA